jgi:hypothetical protein
MERRAVPLLIFLVTLVLVTTIAVSADLYAWKYRSAEHARVFQRACGGLGMGAIATPIWQLINYDPRVLSVDDSITWPIPGGYSYGPDRTGTVSYFEEVPEDQWIEHSH